jgi:hypothetical protein
MPLNYFNQKIAQKFSSRWIKRMNKCIKQFAEHLYLAACTAFLSLKAFGQSLAVKDQCPIYDKER